MFITRITFMFKEPFIITITYYLKDFTTSNIYYLAILYLCSDSLKEQPYLTHYFNLIFISKEVVI